MSQLTKKDNSKFIYEKVQIRNMDTTSVITYAIVCNGEKVAVKGESDCSPTTLAYNIKL